MLNRRQSLDLAFRAISDPTRRAIVERLASGPASVSEIAAPLPMSLPAVHQHLQVLEKAGLMTWEKKGRVRWCRLESTRLGAVEEWIGARRRSWERRLDALGTHLARRDQTQQGGKP
jgi:DNA-binding transcriptional ArsR family regulator